MSNERELEAGIEWYENADWGNEDYKDGVVRGFQAGAEWQRAQQSAQAGYVALGEQAIIDQQAARIALYERALLVSWPEGAKGEVYDLWNEARTMGSKGDGN